MKEDYQKLDSKKYFVLCRDEFKEDSTFNEILDWIGATKGDVTHSDINSIEIGVVSFTPFKNNYYS